MPLRETRHKIKIKLTLRAAEAPIRSKGPNNFSKSILARNVET